MKDNYLWDRTGEVDPDVQKLEEILGALRYQPSPLRIPANLQIGRRRSVFPGWAIAAAIALLAVALGFWFSFTRRQAGQTLEASRDSQVDQKQNLDQSPRNSPRNQNDEHLAVRNAIPPPDQKRQRQSSRSLLAKHKNRRGRLPDKQPELTAAELGEKEQVLLALRLVSAKLNIAQRRTQGPPPLNIIRNHRIG